MDIHPRDLQNSVPDIRRSQVFGSLCQDSYFVQDWHRLFVQSMMSHGFMSGNDVFKLSECYLNFVNSTKISFFYYYLRYIYHIYSITTKSVQCFCIYILLFIKTALLPKLIVAYVCVPISIKPSAYGNRNFPTFK